MYSDCANKKWQKCGRVQWKHNTKIVKSMSGWDLRFKYANPFNNIYSFDLKVNSNFSNNVHAYVNPWKSVIFGCWSTLCSKDYRHEQLTKLYIDLSKFKNHYKFEILNTSLCHDDFCYLCFSLHLIGLPMPQSRS